VGVVEVGCVSLGLAETVWVGTLIVGIKTVGIMFAVVTVGSRMVAVGVHALCRIKNISRGINNKVVLGGISDVQFDFSKLYPITLVNLKTNVLKNLV